ncbi:MAG: wax ester/triacylglycerol synthase family O-acyltransferase [Alteromonadaceae bacterium]|nr:wax ester/triacylglycerol synthase family O-acyltransferase [Alteromonadaceae bacterium]
MQALSGLDASFLFLETNKIPMHIGGVAILEGTLEFDAFRTFLAERVHTVDKMTQKLVTSPMNVDRPHWLEDEDFDLNLHLMRTALPRPGGWKELRYIASKVFSTKLDRDRPLWEFTFVEGIDTIPQVPKGSVAVISKIHHSAFDGKSGAELMSMLFDVSPTPKKVPAKKDKPKPKAPGAVSLLTQGAFNVVGRTTKLPGLLWETGKATLKTSYIARKHGIDMPTLPFSAPKTRFNDSVSAERIWDSSILDLHRVKAIRKAVKDSTLNDVVLTICAGALRKYLQEKDELPDKPLVAMVPVSTRTEAEKEDMGNQVAAMYIQLATDEADPIKRLETIHINTIIGKLYQDAIDARKLMGYAEVIPFGLAGVAARYYSRANIAKKHNAIFNLVITNVPGPQIPLYMAGQKLLVNMGTAPIIDGMGLIIPVFSYNGTISISPTSAVNMMPDMAKFCRYVRESANELEAAALALLEKDAKEGTIAHDITEDDSAQ